MVMGVGALGRSTTDADHPRWPVRVLPAIVTAVIVLNLVDAVLTVLWVQLGVAREANVLLEGVLDHSAVLFMVVKMALVSLGLAILWRHRTRPLAVFGIALAFCAYATLTVHHLRVAAVAVSGA